MSLPVQYSWFWQPSLDGKPGLLMIVDNHPGPQRTDVKMVLECLTDVVLEIESKLPREINLGTLKIFCREPQESWFEIAVDPISRQVDLGRPEIPQGELAMLWEARL